MPRFAYLIVPCFLIFAVFGDAATSFEIADVHVSPHSDNPSFRVLNRDGRYELLGATMVDLVGTAYGVKPEVVTGGPSWVEADRFDVIAKTPVGATAETLRPMLQALLAERFGLVQHNGTALRPALLLTAGKQPRLKTSDGSGTSGCEDQPAEHSDTINGALGCRNMTMAAFADILRTNSTGPVSGYISGNEVVDMTGMKGAWDFNFKWTGRGLLAKAGSDAITLPDAIDRQLGLKLEMGKAPLPALAIDSVNEKPTGNLPGVTEKLPALKLEFDVVDIKPSTQDKPTTPKFTAGGRMEVRGVTLIALIQHAWGLDTYDNELISGGEKWLTTERFDIVAKAVPPDGASSSLKDDDSLRAMLRNMLADSFKLTVHNEEKPVTVYVLSADKPKLKAADPAGRTKCSEAAAPPAGPARLPQRAMTCSNVTAAQFADRLHDLAPRYIDRPVVDNSGITGTWDISLLYSPPAVVQAAVQTADADPNGATSLFEAMGKQLGLKLATDKRPMPALVIDHVEQRPADN